MVSQPSRQQNGKTNLSGMMISGSPAKALQVVQSVVVVFQKGEKAFNVAAFALVSAIVTHPLQSRQRFLACLAGIMNDLGRCLKHLYDKTNDSFI